MQRIAVPQTRPSGESWLVVTLQMALARPPVAIALELRRLNGEILQCELPFPDGVSALVLKSLATTVRPRTLT